MAEWVTPACFQVDFTAYPRVTRAIRRMYRRPSVELQALIINFLHSPRLSVPRRRDRYTGKASHTRAMNALAGLHVLGYIELLRKGQQGKYATVYQRTERFEATFRFRKLPKRLVVQRSALTRESLGRMTGQDIAAVPGLETYARLVSGVKLSLSNGNQVFEDVALRRLQGARLYQMGIHGFQTIPKEERPFLLINGRPTTELDYVSLHPSMLLNMAGRPCPETDIYTTVLKRLGCRKSGQTRGAMKLIFLIAININTVRGFCSYLGRACEAYREQLKDTVKPKDIYSAIVGLYPELRPYVCTGKRAFALQKADSEIMVDALETLAKMGIVSLPEHDSVICPREHQETAKQVMIEVYRRHTGYVIGVKH